MTILNQFEFHSESQGHAFVKGVMHGVESMYPVDLRFRIKGPYESRPGCYIVETEHEIKKEV